MSPLEFDHQLNARALKLRRSLNNAAQCMNYATMALERCELSTRKMTLRLQASTMRLQRCMEAHGL